MLRASILISFILQAWRHIIRSENYEHQINHPSRTESLREREKGIRYAGGLVVAEEGEERKKRKVKKKEIFCERDCGRREGSWQKVGKKVAYTDTNTHKHAQTGGDSRRKLILNRPEIRELWFPIKTQQTLGSWNDIILSSPPLPLLPLLLLLLLLFPG